MTSTDSEQPSSQELQNAMRRNAESVRDVPDLEDLKRRLDDLELLIEEVALAQKLREAVAEYVQGAKEELADLRNFRWWVTTFATVAAVGFFFFITSLVLMQPMWFEALEGKFQLAVLLSFGGGSVILFSMILRGIYRTKRDREHEEILPEHLRMLVEAASNAANK